MNASKLLPALCLLVSLNSSLHAQNPSPDGYYINLKGDTVSGKFINYPEYNKNPVTIAFQPAGSSRVLALAPADCRKISIAHSDTYISYKGKRLVNETDYRNAQSKSDDEYEEVTVFLRELFNDGHYQLYQLSDNRRNNYYVSSASIPLEELYFKAYTEDNKIVESPQFRSQLSVLFPDSLKNSGRLQQQLENTSYTAESIERVFAYVTSSKMKKTRAKYKAQFFAGAGASFNIFHVKGDESQDPSMVGNYNTQLNPVIEAGVKLYHQRNFGRLFFLIRANVYQYSNKMHFPGYVYSPGSGSTTTFKATVISVPASIGYQFVHTKEVTIAFSAGISPMLLSGNIEKLKLDISTYTTQTDNATTLTYTILGELEATWKKKISFYAGGYLPASVANYILYTPQHSSIKAGIRYYIF